MSISQNLQDISQRIQNACKKVDREPDSVRLLLATKTVSADKIKEAILLGNPLIGENKVQEVEEKYADLKSVRHESHFIGHLQTNKIKHLLRCDIDCIQSVDRMKLVRRLQNRLVFEDKELDVFIQVNTSGEKSKFGIHPDKALDFIKEASAYDRLHIRGLMTIGLFSSDANKVRPCFRLLREIRDEVNLLGITKTPILELSMGMSKDLETAIEEGATIVRVGTSIFGERPYPDSYYWNEGS